MPQDLATLEARLSGLKRADLQAVAKQFSVRANLASKAIINELCKVRCDHQLQGLLQRQGPCGDPGALSQDCAMPC